MSSPAPIRRALVVMGMHRSGTSALTRVTNLLGASLPAQLLQLDPTVPNETNELGFWEGLHINTINNTLLAEIGSRWDDVSAIDETAFRTDAARALTQQVTAYLNAEFGHSALFVIKDPRIARLAPLWQDALDAFGAETNFLIPVRKPLEVAGSLMKRDGMGRAQSLLLWLRHVIDAERHSRGHKRSFVSYEALLADWRGVMRGVARHCGFEWPRFNAAAEMEIDGFLSPDRRHNVASADQIADTPRWVREVYGILEEASRTQIVDSARIDEILVEMDGADLLYGAYAQELDVRLRDLRTEHVEVQTALSHEQARAQHLAEAEQRAHALELALHTCQAELTELTTQAQQRQAEQAVIAERIGTLEQGDAAARARIALLEQDLAAETGERSTAVAERDRLRAKVADLRHERSLADERQAELEQRAEREVAERVKIELDLQQTRDELQRAHDDIRRAREELSSASEKIGLAAKEKNKLADAHRVKLGHAERELAGRDESIARLRVRVAELERGLRAIPFLRQRMDELNSRSDEEAARLADLEGQVQAARNDVKAQRQRTREAGATLLGARNTLVTAEHQLGVTVRALTEMAGELSATQDELERARRNAEGNESAAAELEQVRAQLERLRSSYSWRLTQPLRRLLGTKRAPSLGSQVAADAGQEISQ